MVKGIYLEESLITSKAFHDLSGGAIKVLILFMRRQRRKKKGKNWVTTNNGEIEFPYNQAEKLHGIPKATFARCIKELIDHGFLEVTRPGVAISKVATQYNLDDRWAEWGTERFKAVEKKHHPSYRPNLCLHMATTSTVSKMVPCEMSEKGDMSTDNGTSDRAQGTDNGTSRVSLMVHEKNVGAVA